MLSETIIPASLQTQRTFCEQPKYFCNVDSVIFSRRTERVKIFVFFSPGVVIQSVFPICNQSTNCLVVATANQDCLCSHQLLKTGFRVFTSSASAAGRTYVTSVFWDRNEAFL